MPVGVYGNTTVNFEYSDGMFRAWYRFGADTLEVGVSRDDTDIENPLWVPLNAGILARAAGIRRRMMPIPR